MRFLAQIHLTGSSCLGPAIWTQNPPLAVAAGMGFWSFVWGSEKGSVSLLQREEWPFSSCSGLLLASPPRTWVSHSGSSTSPHRENHNSSLLEGVQLKVTDAIVPNLILGMVCTPSPTLNQRKGLASKILLSKRAAARALLL